MTVSEHEDLIIDDLRTDTVGAPASHQTERLVGAGFVRPSACRPARLSLW
jgi:hypothetical protein